MRKYYIDNLRFLTVLLLFPFHTCMIYNNFGENFYVKGPGVESLTYLIYTVSPWFMPLLFVIAGISSAYALKKRTAMQYLKERIFKLFVPMIFGILIYVPIQTYFAERYHNNYTGGFLHQYILFFTKPTDLSGYTGGFTLAHLWFILYLFLISLAALPIMWLYIKSAHRIDASRLSLAKLIPMFLIPTIFSPILEISGKSFGQFFALFLLGFFVLSEDAVMDRLEKHRSALGTAVSILYIAYLAFYLSGHASGICYDIFYRLLMWVSILFILGMGKHSLNFNNLVTAYLSKASFPIYFFHQTWLVAAAFYVFKITSILPLQFILILLISVLVTFANYELFRRISVTRLLFGIKK